MNVRFVFNSIIVYVGMVYGGLNKIRFVVKNSVGVR